MHIRYYHTTIKHGNLLLVLHVEAAIPVSSEVCFTPRLHVSLVVSKGPVVESLEVSISSLSSPGR